jgi:N-acetyl-anhydromuramyl-L-alanine amidase AmpD
MRVEMHPSWRYSWLSTPEHKPLAIVAHYSATDHGTAMSMAKRRQQPWQDFAAAHRKSYPGKTVPQNSWHVSIEPDKIIQMAPLTSGCWHVGSLTAKQIPGVGWGNRTATGIEIIGWGKAFPASQVALCCDVWRALVQTYGIKREHAMVEHAKLDPGRRSDPGPIWMGKHAPTVLDYAYAP